MKKLLITASFLFLSTTANAADDQAIAIAQITAKLTQLEEQNRTLTGKIEELEYKISQAHAAAAAAITAAQAKPAAPAAAPVLGQFDAVTPLSPATAAATPVTTTGSGATVTKPNEYVTKVAEPEKPAIDETAAEAEFDNIFNKSVATEDYKTAKPALKGFIAKYPSTELAGEAYFWLGEIAWSERDFNSAAINYLKGYKESPTGEKASENILKMALTLKELKKPEEACKYVARFETEFPAAHHDLQTKAAAAKSALGCK